MQNRRCKRSSMSNALLAAAHIRMMIIACGKSHREGEEKHRICVGDFTNRVICLLFWLGLLKR